ncbi:thiol-disulfide oxidoreductase DCC family protein [Mycobacterium sp. 050134]|uniref:thiol-disulfide oxidoreductase DCC family protein n=1 Tax=Mycobacterium sp. 050134 TaxID=3096111 RepID=UPI002EDB12ED
MNAETPPILLYDGVCGFCNLAVRTIIRFDRKGTLRFAALDTDLARAIIDRHPSIKDVESVVFVDQPGDHGERVAVRSEAALRVVDYLGGPWRVFGAARIIPAPLRDGLYDRVAAIRYRLFGKYDTCPIPPPEVRARFLGS